MKTNLGFSVLVVAYTTIVVLVTLLVEHAIRPSEPASDAPPIYGSAFVASHLPCSDGVQSFYVFRPMGRSIVASGTSSRKQPWKFSAPLGAYDVRIDCENDRTVGAYTVRVSVEAGASGGAQARKKRGEDGKKAMSRRPHRMCCCCLKVKPVWCTHSRAGEFSRDWCETCWWKCDREFPGTCRKRSASQ